jgi:electron transport complex protein RnfG
MKTMIKLSFVLAAYAVVACVGLAFVYIATAPRIAAAAEAETKGALRAIFPAASDFDEVTGQVAAADESVSIDRAYVARDGDAVLGMVLQATGATYKTSTILVGVDMSRRLLPLVFVANTDTPGLGTKTAEEPFVGQFSSKSIDDPLRSARTSPPFPGRRYPRRASPALCSSRVTRPATTSRRTTGLRPARVPRPS